MHLFTLSENESKDFHQLIAVWTRDQYVTIMKHFIQHGVITTYDHSLSVAAIAFWFNRRWRLGADEERLIRCAILHDFFLYDWHGSGPSKSVTPLSLLCGEKFKGLPLSKVTNQRVGIGPGNWTHSYKHPLIASENASHIFGIDRKEQKIIECHMWPYTFWRLPSCREAWIIVLADKYCSSRETLFCRKHS